MLLSLLLALAALGYAQPEWIPPPQDTTATQRMVDRILKDYCMTVPEPC